ncbi:LysR family transcriptional regulator [Acuticoccus sediminis]|uniref:LysR family transcriptional regulator n=1 Tax=Acuticoccus sediminis TaxID=2184697 RepID=A0A8B2NW09_9HYPH|nr:LysR substrate-binding domain-containing protein [Acuticoccus sediminis]RAH99896.1 LysR family transcriptional regulator [Acuticoccus sediminis]
MNFAQIRAFYYVFREGGVGRAAHMLNVSQPTISQHLKALEAEADVRLFERRGRGLVLTADGAQVFAAVERMMRAAADVEDALANEGSLDGGHLRVVSDSPPLSVRLLKRFRDRHRNVAVSITVASKATIMARLEDGEADVGITVEPTLGVDFIGLPLQSEGLALCVWRDHPLTRMRHVGVGVLEDEVLLMREASSRTRGLVEQALAQLGISPRETVEIGDREALREAVAAKIGVTAFAMSECPPDPRLHYLPIHQAEMSLVLHEHLVFRKRIRARPEVAAFIEIAREYGAAGMARDGRVLPRRTGRGQEPGNAS